MATRDHKARARPSFSLGEALSDPPDADPPASSPPAPPQRPLTPADVDVAVYCLTVLCIADERWREAQATQTPYTGPAIWPLPPTMQEALVVALKCLEAFAVQLDPGKS